MISYFTIDVEDPHEGREFPDGIFIDTCDWTIDRLVGELADLCAERGTTATLFCTERAARGASQTLRAMVDGGHRLAVHGKTHQLVRQVSRASFLQGVRETKAFLEDLGGQVVCGYRAPYWSIGREELPLLADLADLGFTYDSSIFPFHNMQNGMSRAPLEPYRHPSGLIEIPPSVAAIGPVRFPFSGGFYLRLLPAAVLTAVAGHVLQKRPLILFVHPWELGGAITHALPIGGVERLLRTWGTTGTRRKLRALLALTQFRPIEDSPWLDGRATLPVVDLSVR